MARREGEQVREIRKMVPAVQNDRMQSSMIGFETSRSTKTFSSVAFFCDEIVSELRACSRVESDAIVIAVLATLSPPRYVQNARGGLEITEKDADQTVVQCTLFVMVVIREQESS